MKYSYRYGVYKKKIAYGAAALSLAVTSLVGGLPLIFGGTAAAAGSTVYNNIPSPQPPNVVSQAFEATQTSEFGGQIQLAGTQRTGLSLTVLMSSWGCESGDWSHANCVTTPGATFDVPITANVYAVNADNSVGAKLTTMTQTFKIPYRPSTDATCGTGQWRSSADHQCYNGYATPITFNKSTVTWPDKVIVSVAYNTTHYGYAPLGENTSCYTTDGGCGYDSLNVGLTDPADENNPTAVVPTTGSNPQPANVYTNAAGSYGYCDGAGDIGPTGVFRETAACWLGYQPLFKVTSAVNAPTNKDQCKNDGYKNYTDEQGNVFKNQGQCVSYTNGRGQ